MVHVQVLAHHFLSPDILGGGDRVFIELCRKWQGKGVKVEVVCPENGVEICKRCGLTAEYVALPKVFFEKSSSVLAIGMLFVVRALLGCRVRPRMGKAVIYTPGDFICNVIPAAFLRRILGERVKWVAHVFFVIPPPASREISFGRDFFSFLLQRISFALMAHFADLVVVLNSTTKRQLIQCGIASEKVCSSSGGVDLSSIERAARAPGLLYDACFVGRIHPGKGAFELVDIWKMVAKARKDAKLAIVGSGSPHYTSMLSAAIKREALESNVDLLGFVPFPFGIMKSSKMLLYPDHEAGYGWGLAVCESLACGTPVIAYDMPVYKEYFPAGMQLVKFGDLEGFSKAALLMLGNDEMRTHQGKLGKEIAQRYDWAVVADELICAFRQLFSEQ